MIRLRILLLAAGLAVGGAASSAEAGQASIRSQAELQRYLEDTPVEATPLAPLSPGGRQRFLAQLVWSAHGLGGLSLDDVRNELTHDQAVRLLSLFGASSSADSLGLSASTYARLQAERAAEARARGCDPGACPQSTIEQHYDSLVLERQDPSLPDAVRSARIARRYEQLFAAAQRPDVLSAISRPDLRLLRRAASFAAYGAPDAPRIADLQADLAEMQRRGMVEDTDYRDLYLTLIGAREFAAAATLREQRPGMDVAPLPRFVPDAVPRTGLPTVLSVDARSDTMRRQAIDLGGPLRIVVIAGCHFSEDAAKAIEADAPLRSLFARHSVWLAEPSQPLEAVAEWNRQFADLPMHVAWRQDEWPMLPSWAMPTYYIFRHGRLVARFGGWQGTSELRRALHAAGAL